MPVPLQTLAQVLEQPRVLLVPMVRIHYLPTLRHVRPVPILPTPPLSNAPLVPIKQLPPVTQGIMGMLVMLLVKHVLPVPLRILEQVPGQPRVLVVLVARIHYLPTLRHVRLVPPLPTPPLSTAPLVPIKKLPPVTLDIMDLLVMPLVKRAMPVPLQIRELVLEH